MFNRVSKANQVPVSSPPPPHEARLVRQGPSIFRVKAQPNETLPIPSTWEALNDPAVVANSQHLGQVQGGFTWLAGATIGLLGFLATKNPYVGLGEVLGFGSFFGAMAATPRVIHALVKQRTGVELDRYYLSSQGDRRWFFQDTNYLPLQLLPDEDLEQAGRKLHIPKHLPNRREVIEDRIRQVAAQSQTFWMVLAGPLTPILASAAGHLLEGPLARGVMSLRRRYLETAMKQGWGDPKKLSEQLIENVFGKNPYSPTATWWRKVHKSMVHDLGIMDHLKNHYAVGDIRLVTRRSLEHTMTRHLNSLVLKPHRAHRDHSAGIINKWAKRMAGLRDELTNLKGKAQYWVGPFYAQSAKNQLPDQVAAHQKTLKHTVDKALDAASGFFNQAENLKQALLDDKTSHERLATILKGGNDANLGELLEKGDAHLAQTIVGDRNAFYKLLGLQQRNQTHHAASMTGGNLIQHMASAVIEEANKLHWRNRVLGWGGGLVAAASGLYYLVGLGKTTKPPESAFVSMQQILEKYNRNGEFEAFQRELQMLRLQRAMLPPRSLAFERPGYLKQLFQTNQSIIYALNIRNFAANDWDGDGLIDPLSGEQGTFLSAIARLDELAKQGVNTLHLLPINPIGVLKKGGEAGSVYAPADLHTLNPQLADPSSPLNVYEQARVFVQECHKRGIQVMVDIPSCASIDLALTHPELIDVDEEGRTRTPANWADIVKFKNDEKLRDYYEGFFRLMVNDLGIDGFRVDVARARPAWFWKYFMDKYPNQAWLAESYTEEDASPLTNIQRDTPEKFLRVGFDSIYGQNHIFHKMTGQEYLRYLSQMDSLMHRATATPLGQPTGKSIIGSFLTHDDEETLIHHGGPDFSRLVIGLMAFQPFTNPYILDGFTSGYDKRIDIFNYSPALKGEHPEIGDYMAQVNGIRKRYASLLATGVFQPLALSGDPKHDSTHQLFAYTLNSPTQRLLVIGNKTPNSRARGVVHVDNVLQNGQLPALTNVVPAYGERCDVLPFATQTGAGEGVYVDMGPSRLLVFELPPKPTAS